MSGVPVARLTVGDEESWTHRVSAADVDRFAELSGDVNPLHMDAGFARRHGFRGRVVHGMLLAAYVSRQLGTRLPGFGALWLGQEMRFPRAVCVGDSIEVRVRVKHVAPNLQTLVLETTILNEDGETVMSGEARMMAMPSGERPEWSDTVAIVTGGSRGIGAAVCAALGARGASVVIGCNSGTDAARGVAETVDSAGGTGLVAAADLSAAGGGKALAETALERFGRADIVVNCASPPIVRKSFEETEWGDVDEFWRVYVQSFFELSKAVVPEMRSRGFGRFVHVLTSAIWGAPPPSTSGYVAAKSAAWGLARGMAVDLAPDGISVNAVSPSAVVSDQWSEEPDARLRAVAAKIPLRRLAGVEEVAAAVLFLAGEGGDYITGANLPVAGGEVM